MKKTRFIMTCLLLVLILASCGDTWKPQENITGEETIKEDGDSLRTNENTPTQVPTSTITPTLTPTIPPLSKEQLLAMTYSEVADYIRLTALSDRRWERHHGEGHFPSCLQDFLQISCRSQEFFRTL